MIVHAGVHGADERDVIRDGTEMGQQLREFHATLAMAAELPDGCHDLATGLCSIVELQVAREALAIAFDQFGFGVKEIDLAGAT